MLLYMSDKVIRIFSLNGHCKEKFGNDTYYKTVYKIKYVINKRIPMNNIRTVSK